MRFRPQENWGLLPYYSFRSNSEQEKRNDPEVVLTMAYHDDLLGQAFRLVHNEPRNTKAGQLAPSRINRPITRSFHLLIGEAVAIGAGSISGRRLASVDPAL